MEFSGRLTAFPIGDLLQWAHHDRRTGALVLRRSGREKRIYFRDGEVAACISDDPAEYFGQFLLVSGQLSEGDLVRALTACRKNGKRLGVALHELGILAPDVILGALRQQIQDLVCDVFLWPHGVFFFEAEMPPDEELLPEPLSPVALAMEGSRWRDHYERIREVYVHDHIVLKPGVRWPGESLAPLERRIVREIDGRHDLTELFKLVRGSYFRFLGAAYDLAVREVLDIQEVRDETDAASHELHLADLLVEQAAEEQVLFFRGHWALPIDLLANFFPIWVRSLDPEEEKRLAAPAREFYGRFDGRASLAAIFSTDDHERNREMELLIEQLRKGAIALLPASLDELEREAEARHEPPLRRWWQRLSRSHLA